MAVPIAAGVAGVAIAGQVASLALTTMAHAIRKLYGIAGEMNAYLDKHIEDMKGSADTTVSRLGRVLEMAKFGFGIGYVTSVVVIAAGNLVLGDPLGAFRAVASAAVLANPVASTCAAVGAIYMGWGALSEVERQEILDKLSKGLEIGVELIKAIVRFVIEKVKELLDSKNLQELKKLVASAAAGFGKSLSGITHKVVDVVSDGLGAAKKLAGEAMDKGGDFASAAYDTAKEAANKTADGAREVIKKVKRGANSVDDQKAGKGQGSLLETPKSRSPKKKI